MKALLEFIVGGILGDKKYQVDEETENDRVILTIKTDPDVAGLIIGRQGKTINNIRNLLKVKATLAKKMVNVNVSTEQTPTKLGDN